LVVFEALSGNTFIDKLVMIHSKLSNSSFCCFGHMSIKLIMML
jgi:hypothetical protein